MHRFVSVQTSLLSSAGKKRLWVITAPSHNDHYLRMMEKQLEDVDQVVQLYVRTYNSREKMEPTPLFFHAVSSERIQLPPGRKGHLHHNHHPECHDGRQNPENNLPRRRHRGEPGPGHGQQTAALP